MVVLALDTTTRGGSCALTRDGVLLIEHSGDASTPQGSRVPGAMVALLAAADLTLDAVDAFAVAVGPGSFTGLRVGISAMQGLAFASGKPLIGVSTLDALSGMAGRTHPDARVAAWIDAWRGEVYAAVYAAGAAIDGPMVAAPAALLGRMDGTPTVFIGDGAATYAAIIQAHRGPTAVLHDPGLPPLAGIIGQMATARRRAGEQPSAAAIRPIYLRRPGAEALADAGT